MDDLRRARFEEQQVDVMEVEHILTSPFRFLIDLAKWGFLLLFLAVWTVGVFAYQVIGGGDVHTRATAARDLIGGDGSEARTYILDLGQRSFTEQYSPTKGYGSSAPICRTTGWDYNTQADSGIKRQAATLAIAYQNSTIMASAMRRIFTVMKENATYAADDTWNSVNLCDPILDETIVLKQAPVVRIRYASDIIAGVCLKDHCNFGSDDEQSNWSSWLSVGTSYRNDDLSPNITWFDSGTLSDGQQMAVDAMNQMSTDAFWLQAAHDNGIHDDTQVLRFAQMARVYRDHIMWPNGKGLMRDGGRCCLFSLLTDWYQVVIAK
jgi:hypothetical protein